MIKEKKKIIAVMMFLFALALISGFFLFKQLFLNDEENRKVQLEEEKEITNNLSLVIVGDVLLHSTLYKEARIESDIYDFDYIFDEVKILFNGYDLKFYNQESIIGGKDLGLSTYPRFNSPDEIGDTMVNMNFNLVSLANNHTLDKGENGIIYSVNYWKTKDAMTAGSYLSEEERINSGIGEKNGIKYAFLAYTTFTNGLKVPEGKSYLVNIYDEELVKQDIQRVKDKVDIIIVSMHWGVEYVNNPNKSQRQIASYLSSLGVDIVIGHHPHVIQPIEFIGNTLVFYSLGNFLSGQSGSDKLTGLVASINIKMTTKGEVKIKEISSINADLVYTYHKSYSNYKIYPYTKLTTNIFPDYIKYYNKYRKILTSLNQNVIVTNIEE